MHVLRVGRMLLTVSVVGWLSWTSLHAQETSVLAPGDSIRLRTSVSGQLTGRVQSLTADTLVLQTGRVPITVPLGEITQLERRRGRGRSAWTGAKRGALIGAIPAAISLGLQHEQVGEQGSSVGKAMALGAISGGLFGGLIGAAIGAGRGGDRWDRIDPSLLVVPSVGGSLHLRFSASLAF